MLPLRNALRISQMIQVVSNQIRDLLWATALEIQNDSAKIFFSGEFFFTLGIRGKVHGRIILRPGSNILVELEREKVFKSDQSFC